MEVNIIQKDLLLIINSHWYCFHFKWNIFCWCSVEEKSNWIFVIMVSSFKNIFGFVWAFLLRKQNNTVKINGVVFYFAVCIIEVTVKVNISASFKNKIPLTLDTKNSQIRWFSSMCVFWRKKLCEIQLLLIIFHNELNQIEAAIHCLAYKIPQRSEKNALFDFLVRLW